MDLSKIRMVVTDMDGTLLNSKHEVSDRFFEIFNELKQKNIQFVAASGRQYNSMLDKLSSIKDDIYFIAENGAYIRKNNSVLLTTPLEKKAYIIFYKYFPTFLAPIPYYAVRIRHMLLEVQVSFLKCSRNIILRSK